MHKNPRRKPAPKPKETTPKQDKSKSKVQSGWVGNYYVKSDGKRAKNEWVDGGRYYVDSDGKRLKVTGFMIKTMVHIII
nr:hypothetical protein [Streptococcus mitis]